MKKKAYKNDFLRIITLESIVSKVIIVLAVIGLLQYISMSNIIETKTNDLAYELVLNREKSDINYLQDLIKKRTTIDTKAEWDIINGNLCYGGVVIGNGTEERAYFTPFFETENKTGTFCYAYMRTSDYGAFGEGLKWIGDETYGYQEGHFIRAAGSTRGKMGESLVGTYIEKSISDVLDRKGEYAGPAIVKDQVAYCYYKVLRNKRDQIVGCITVGRSLQDIEEMILAVKESAKRVSVVVIGLAVLILFAIIGKWLFIIRRMNKYVNTVATGKFPEENLDVKSNDEMGELATNINDMMNSLKEKQRMGAELTVATNIQANLLPTTFPAFPEFPSIDIFASMKPAKEVGGDFYDFFKVDDTHIACVMADVSGKGVPAALFMVIAKTLIKNYTQVKKPPFEVFTEVNNVLLESDDAGLFVTAWMCILDINTGELVYANAGHNAPVLYTEGKGFEYFHAPAGLVLAGMPGIKYKQNSLVLNKGDKLFLYTDGVTEATNVNNELYGEDRLKDCLNKNNNLDAKKMILSVKKSLDEFVGGAEQFDDITMLCLQYN